MFEALVEGDRKIPRLFLWPVRRVSAIEMGENVGKTISVIVILLSRQKRIVSASHGHKRSPAARYNQRRRNDLTAQMP